MIRFRFLLLLLGITIISACSLIDKKEEIAVFIRIRDAMVEVHDDGSLTVPAGLKDIWVTHADQLIGIYKNGSLVPILPKNNQLILEGGIYESGLSGLRIPYPFWKPLTMDISASRGDSMILTPIFTYLDTTAYNIAYQEDFELLSVNLSGYSSGTDTVGLLKVTSSPFEGSYCGKGRFNATHTRMELIGSAGFQVVTGQNPWIEITYKSDVPDLTLSAGFFYEYPASAPVSFGTDDLGIVLLPRSEWTTVYLHMVDVPKKLTGQDVRYKFWMKANGGGNSGNLFIDHIRVIHFN